MSAQRTNDGTERKKERLKKKGIQAPANLPQDNQEPHHAHTSSWGGLFGCWFQCTKRPVVHMETPSYAGAFWQHIEDMSVTESKG